MPKYNTFIEDKNGERIDFILDVAKRSRLNMGIRDGTLTVRVPYGCSKQQLESFINNNLGWIKEQKDKVAVGLPKDFCDGERLRLLGNELTLTLVQADKYFSPKIEDGKLLIAVNKTSDQTYVKEQKQAYFHKLKAYRFPQRVHRLCLPPRALPLGLYGSQQGFLGFGGQVLSRLARYKRRNERLTMQSYPTKYTHVLCRY